MRVSTRLVSVLLATLLAIAASVALAELALAALGRTPWLVDWRAAEDFGQEHSWDAAAVRLIAIGLVVVGLALLIAAIRPRPPVVVESGLGSGETRIRVRRRSLEALLGRTAEAVDGVTTATARWHDGVFLRASTSRARTDGIAERVADRVDRVLRTLRIEAAPTRVAVRSTADRRDAAPSPLLPPPPPPSDEASPATEPTGALR